MRDSQVGQQSAHRARWWPYVYFALSVVDVVAFRTLVIGADPQPSTVEKVVYEMGADDRIVVTPTEFTYPMLPRPSFYDEGTLLLPPGYSVRIRPDAGLKRVRVKSYEDRGPPLFLVDTGDRLLSPTVDGAGVESFFDATRTPVPFASVAALRACFDEGDATTFRVSLASDVDIEGGRCRFRVSNASGHVVIQSPTGAARIESVDDAPLAHRHLRLWMVALVLFVSLLHRAAFFRASMWSTEVTALFAVVVASFFTPMWIVLYGAKVFGGLVVGALRVLRAVERRTAILVGAGVVVFAVAVSVVVDPMRVAEWNTEMNGARAGASSSSIDPVAGVTHLVLGASLVNGAALREGAYGAHAIDGMLQDVCPDASRVFARHAVDGGGFCFMRDAWREVQHRSKNIDTRVMFVGLNDDVTAPASRVSVWIATMVSMLPGTNPWPETHSIWARGAKSNLQQRRADELAQCFEDVLAASTGRAIVVDEIASFDLGGAREFGREGFSAARRALVEKTGGVFLDMGTLLRGQSPMFFNDFSHLSALGMAETARGICAALTPAPAARVAPDHDDGAVPSEEAP